MKKSHKKKAHHKKTQNTSMPKKPIPRERIWELDAFRGFCILAMVLIHFVYDLTGLYQVIEWEQPRWFFLLQHWGGLLFLVLSGVCVTLGRHHVRRGLVVLFCGFLCTAVTYIMYKLNLASRAIIIWFGALHCLGCCMLLWYFFKKLPNWALGICSAILIAVGIWLRTRLFDFHWLMPLGFLYPGFASSDYFPLLLNLGVFLAGAILGRKFYSAKKTLLPGISGKNPAIRFLSACGKHSLWIYLLHQPILAGISALLAMLKG